VITFASVMKSISHLASLCLYTLSRVRVCDGLLRAAFHQQPVAGASSSSKRWMTGARCHHDGKSLSSKNDLSRRQAWERVAGTAITTASGLVLPGAALTSAAGTSEPLVKVPTVRLGDSSLEVSRTIQGHWQLAGGHGRYREADAIANMEAHFKAGITTLDTADICECKNLHLVAVRSGPPLLPNSIPHVDDDVDKIIIIQTALQS